MGGCGVGLQEGAHASEAPGSYGEAVRPRGSHTYKAIHHVCPPCTPALCCAERCPVHVFTHLFRRMMCSFSSTRDISLYQMIICVPKARCSAFIRLETVELSTMPLP